MDSQADTGASRSNPRFLIGVAILVTLAAIVILFALVDPTTSASGLLPVLATPTVAQNEGDSLAPIPVTFTELNSDPLAYLNLPIQVSGGFIKLDSPVCPRFSGPNLAWALVAEELQLEAKGFERVVRILAPGTEMTVQGIWRLYQGPLGCGKGPSPGSAWYLQVQRIVQPNPLVNDGSARSIDIEGFNRALPDLLPTDSATFTPAATATLDSIVPAATATLDQFAPTITIEAIGTIDIGAATPTLAPLSATNTPAPGGNTPGPATTPSPTATVGSGGGGPEPTVTPQTPLPPTATETSGDGYLGPATATPTASPNPYPSS